MMRAVQGFNGQLERIAELVVVIIAGAMLSYTYVPPKAVWFVLLLFLVARPGCGMAGPRRRDQRLARPAHPDLLVRHPRRRLDFLPDVRAVNQGASAGSIGGRAHCDHSTTVAASIVLHGILGDAAHDSLHEAQQRERAALKRARGASPTDDNAMTTALGDSARGRSSCV